MRMRNKKGISPLIATVLLIGFTVALGVMVYLWLSGTLQVSNQGKKRIDGFWIAMENGPTPLLPNNIKAGSEEKIGITGAPAGLESVELIPVIIENSVVKTCASNSVKVQCTSS